MKNVKIFIKILLIVVGAYFATTLVSISLSKILVYIGVSDVNATMSALFLSFLVYALIIMALFASSDFKKSMTHLHTWSGLVVGWFLFFIFITGSTGYFNKEIDNWMEPDFRFSLEKYSDEELINTALTQLNIDAPSSRKWQIYLPSQRDNHLKIRYQLPSNKKATAVSFGHGQHAVTKIIDPNIPKAFTQNKKAGGEALYKMHFFLHYMPSILGILFVGIFSMLMLIALLSSLVIHANIFRDYFSFRRGKNVRTWLDAHVLSGVIALAYFFMITYSGLLFFMFFYFPLIPNGNYENGVKEFRKELSADKEFIVFKKIKSQLYSISKITQNAENIFGDDVRRITIVNPKDISSLVIVERCSSTIISRSNDDKLYFNGINGKLVPKSDINITTSHELKKVFLGLHRALFADITLRCLFFISGILGAIMLASGLILWTRKREHAQSKNFGFRIVNSLNIGTIIGLPTGIGVYFLSSRILGDIELNYLFITWALFILLAYIFNSKKVWYIEAYLGAGVYLSLVLQSLIFQNNSMLDLTFNIFFTLSSLVFLLIAFSVKKKLS